MTHPTHDMTEAGCLECGATSIEDLREPCPALATDSDDVWIRARFSVALTALASARAALDAKDAEIRGWQRVLPGYVDRIAALQSALSEATRREEYFQHELERWEIWMEWDKMPATRPGWYDYYRERRAARSAVSRGEENG